MTVDQTVSSPVQQGTETPPQQQPTAQPPEAPQQQPTPQAQPPQEPSLSQREELYRKYYGSQGETSPPAQQAGTGGEPPAQGGPDPGQTPPGGEPPPSADPLAEYLSSFEERMMAKLEESLAGVRQPTPQLQPQQDPNQKPVTWVDLMREGKFDEGETLLASKISTAVEEQLTNRTLETVRVEQEMAKFVDQVRRENPDLVPLEDLIGYRARQRLDATLATGKIQSTPQYMEAYKKAINDSIGDARKLVLELRASGKNEAMVSKQQVLSASTLPPNPVDANRAPSGPKEPQIETAADYLRKRQEDSMARRGFNPNQ